MVMLLWSLLLGVALLVAGGWFMHQYGKEGQAGEVMSLPARLLFTALAFGLIVFVFREFGPILTLFVVLVVGIILGVMWVPTLVSIALNPLSNSLTGGTEPVEKRPYYSRAVGLRKRGEFQTALEAVQDELTRFPGDADGMLLRAQILADDLKDPLGAVETLRQMADTPGRSAEEQCLALNHLADVQWKHLKDAEGSRATLEQIVTGFPESSAAQMARQRLAHLAGTIARSDSVANARLVVTEHTERIGLREDLGASKLVETDGNVAAAELVAHLAEHPQDWEARERLARLYVEPLGRIDLATDELERLLSETQVPVRHVIRWYNELADLQLKAADGVPAARLTLERIVKRFPNSPWAAQAEARLRHLVWDERAKHTTRTIKLGHYEANVGLKRGDASIPDPAKSEPASLDDSTGPPQLRGAD
ncbi:MAG TPA: hypothetical protein PLX89_24550 [Verrucomicrobiota bacterium]|nr:hypothetical protein [Verrucomicrobiales bacterium]HRI16179.1 hypothetical protein [Verrucomicrobiota bacterium]